MPLITDEATAVAILNREASRRGHREGLANFARLTLGAHAAQAKRLAGLADAAARGEDITGQLNQEAPQVSVACEVNGKQLNVELKSDRLPITTLEELASFYAIDLDKWRPVKPTFSFWGNSDKPNFHIRASFEPIEYEGDSQQSREELRAFAREFAALPRPEPAPAPTGEHLLELFLADIHAGRASWDEPITVTAARLRRAVMDIATRASSQFPLARIALVLAGDTFNDDNGKRTTTSGTPQDSVADWQATYRVMRESVAMWVSELRHLAPVELVVLEGNHDRERAWYLADALYGMFAEHDDVRVSLDTHRVYLEHGRVLIGLTHGDTIKDDDLALVMAREADISGKRVLEWHLGHLHTRSEAEHHGVLIRRFRTPAPYDDWHYQKGYAHNVRSVTGMVWHPDKGEVANFPYVFTEEE